MNIGINRKLRKITHILVGRLVAGRQVCVKTGQTNHRPNGEETDERRHQTEGCLPDHVDELLLFVVLGH